MHGRTDTNGVLFPYKKKPGITPAKCLSQVWQAIGKSTPKTKID